MKNDACVCCGAYVPEGRQVCTRCEKAASDGTEAKTVYIFKTNCLLPPDKIYAMRNELKRQIDEGLVILSPAVDFCKTLQINGEPFSVELIYFEEAKTCGK